MNSVDGWLALGTALVSGVLVKLVDRSTRKGERSFDDAVSIRQELREEVRILHANIGHLQHELDCWKDRYYDLSARYQGLQVECQALRQILEDLADSQDLETFQEVQRTLRFRMNPPPFPEREAKKKPES